MPSLKFLLTFLIILTKVLSGFIYLLKYVNVFACLHVWQHACWQASMSAFLIACLLVKVLYVVTTFLMEVGFSRFEEYSSATEIYEKLKANKITVEIVCAYMVLGNLHKRDSIFAGVSDFSCSDPFLAYTYWFLMSNVFLEYRAGNHLPGIEVPLSSKRDDESVEACSERVRRMKIIDIEHKLEELSVNVPVEKKNLYLYFFLPDALPGACCR